MIREFIKNMDFSHIPIGPQADLITAVEELNEQVPHFLGIQLEVTKKFQWKRGTYDQMEYLRSYFLGTLGKYKNVLEVFEKPERNRQAYYLMRFRRQLSMVERMLQRRRFRNEIWIDDDDVVEDLKNDAIEKIVSAFDDFEAYNKSMNNCDIEYYVYNEQNHNSDDFQKLLNELINDSFSFNENKTKIVLREHGTRVYLIHPFKDIIMNVYVSDRTTPMYRFNNGSVLGMYRVDGARLISHALGTTRRRAFGIGGSDFWYKPIMQGLKHPFLQYPGRSYSEGEIDPSTHPDTWNIRMNQTSNSCYGNFNNLNTTDMNIIKWCETTYSWLTTFRVGDTHPLNNIRTGYYGSPRTHDKDVHDDYYDIVGTDAGSCYNQMTSYFDTVTERQSICQANCSERLMLLCNGFKRDETALKRERLVLWVRKNGAEWNKAIEYFNPEDTYPGNFNWSFEGVDDNYPTKYTKINSQEDLQNSMLEWVRNNSDAVVEDLR